MWANAGVNEHLWIEDARAFAAKLELVRKYKLRGYSVWVLGTEDPAVWQTAARAATSTTAEPRNRSDLRPERVAHLDVWRRDFHRPEDRAASLESLHERRGPRLIGPPQRAVELDGIERRDVRARLLRPIDRTVDLHGDARQRNALLARDDVHQFDAARGNAGQEHLDRRDRFAGATVLDRPVDDEVVIARGHDDAAEDVSDRALTSYSRSVDGAAVGAGAVDVMRVKLRRAWASRQGISRSGRVTTARAILVP